MQTVKTPITSDYEVIVWGTPLQGELYLYKILVWATKTKLVQFKHNLLQIEMLFIQA